jgi:thiol-disulfide isomerase/thioredoxin
MKPKQISLVYATWCPHCQPQSVDATKKMSEDLKVPLRLLDIDQQDAVRVADDLVKKYGTSGFPRIS